MASARTTAGTEFIVSTVLPVHYSVVATIFGSSFRNERAHTLTAQQYCSVAGDEPQSRRSIHPATCSCCVHLADHGVLSIRAGEPTPSAHKINSSKQQFSGGVQLVVVHL